MGSVDKDKKTVVRNLVRNLSYDHPLLALAFDFRRRADADAKSAAANWCFFRRPRPEGPGRFANIKTATQQSLSGELA